ncbi:hypothetical protein CNR22_08605 [Sphingobacteriaceae bacterium]|nr:hypothetical protein CNR22_08605 [Sphingobacteriaceae bacterium]
MALLKNIRSSFLFLLCSFATLHAQEFPVKTDQLGFSAGLNLAFGTHFQRLGVNFNFYYVFDHVQANSEIRAYFNFKGLGPKLRYPELVLAQGIVFSAGREKDYFNPFISSVSNQTKYENAIAYSYNAWFNKIKTTQQTGIIAIQVQNFSLITENDILARQMLDRFRTAAALIQYQYKDQFQAAVSCAMWTGSMGRRHEIRRSEFNYECYMDTAGAVYGNTSHGLLSAQIKYNLGYSQNAQLNLGIDAEQVRNGVQNKFIHDMRFIPKKWNKAKNCHIPMLDENNNAYLYQEDQKIRKAKLFLNAFTNANVFY